MKVLSGKSNPFYFISWVVLENHFASFTKSGTLSQSRCLDLGDHGDNCILDSSAHSAYWCSPSKQQPTMPSTTARTMEPAGNHRGGVLLSEKCGFQQSSRGCPVKRNQVGGRACCWRCLYSATPVGSDASLNAEPDIPLTHLQRLKGCLDRC